MFKKETCLFFFSGGTFGYPSAPHLAYPPEGYFMDFGYSGITTISTRDHGVFLLRHMSGDLVLESIVIRASGSPFIFGHG